MGVRLTEGTLDELIAELEEAREVMGGEVQVRVAYQPSHPLRGVITHLTVPDPEPYDEDTEAPGKEGDGQMLWLALGSVPYRENPYGPRWAWQA